MFKRAGPNAIQSNFGANRGTAKTSGIGRGMMQKSNTMYVNQSANQGSLNNLSGLQNKENDQDPMPNTFAEQNKRK